MRKLLMIVLITAGVAVQAGCPGPRDRGPDYDEVRIDPQAHVNPAEPAPATAQGRPCCGG